MTKRHNVSRETGDLGPAERLQHDILASRETERAGVVAVLVMTSGHLSRYHATGLLGEGVTRDDRRDAGHKLAELFHLAGLQPSVISRLSDFTSGGSGQSHVPLQMDAFKRYTKAMDALPRGTNNVVYQVCCHDQPAGSARMELLCRGLDILAWGFFGVRQIAT